MDNLIRCKRTGASLAMKLGGGDCVCADSATCAMTDNDPQPRWLLDDPWFADALLGEIRDLTRILYPEARMQFTPSPWVWETSNSWKRLARSDRGIRMSVLEPFVHWRDQHPDCTVNEADMALIAAAPELYEALSAIVNSTDYGADDERPLMRDARAALAKARGETL